jgi:peptide/nickel transport system substrate-binding protein
MGIKSKLRTILLVAILSLVLVGCAGPQSSQPTIRDAKTLVVAIYGNPVDFDPASNNESLGNLVLFSTTEGLVRADPNNSSQFVPQLAERWENNADYTRWIFYIRKNAKFHDGTSIDADAVRSSFTRLIKSQSSYSFILGQFISDPENQIIVKDKYTIEFQFDRPAPLFLNALSSAYGSYVISPTAVSIHEVDGDRAHQWLQAHEAGSGPYMITDLRPNEEVVLTRFDDWWGLNKDTSFFSKIILKVIPERSTRRSLIEKGDVDITFDFSAADWDSLKKNPDVAVHLDESLTVQYIAMGKYGPLKDPRVRQALSYAFDYDGYVNGIWKGYVTRAYSPFPRRLLCYNPSVFVYETNLDEAKRLLKEAGVSNGLELRYLTTGDRQEALAGQILQNQLAKIGIALKIEQRSVESYTSMVFSDTSWPERPELFGFTWWPDYNDPTDWAWVLFHSDAGGATGGNIGLYSNSHVDGIINGAKDQLNQEELCRQYADVQDILVRQDPAWIPLIEMPNEVVLRKDISGYANNPNYHNVFDFSALFRSVE